MPCPMELSEGLNGQNSRMLVLVCTCNNLRESSTLSREDLAQAVTPVYRYPGSALVSRIETRPAQPPRKA